MEWYHIMDKQPLDGESIVHIDRPDDKGHYTMGMRNYYQKCSWEDFLKDLKKLDIKNPDFWWMYSIDFPFPK